MNASEKHDEGGTCLVVELAYERFGAVLGEHILWEETCFPMDDDVAMDQLRYIVAKADRGEPPTLDGWQEARRLGT
jgi:hypothetical protein